MIKVVAAKLRRNETNYIERESMHACRGNGAGSHVREPRTTPTSSFYIHSLYILHILHDPLVVLIVFFISHFY